MNSKVFTCSWISRKPATPGDTYKMASVLPRVLVRPLPCFATSSRVDLSVFHQFTRHLSNISEKHSRRPRNGKIKHRVVRLVDPETSRLGPPEELSEILQRTDLSSFFVELVTEKPEPIVKLINARDEFLKQKAIDEKKRGQPRPREEKEIQMTWGVSQGDFHHKLEKARQELERGNRVTVIYARRKDQPQLTPEEMEARLQETVDFLADAGAEWKLREANKVTTTLYFQGHNLPPPLPLRQQEEAEKPAISSYAKRKANRAESASS